MAGAAGPEKRPGTWESLRLAATSWRLGAVTLQSFASGLPLGLVWIALPAWLKYLGADLRMIGLFTLTQAPWNLKFLWSPLMDRYAPAFLGRRRGWIVVTEMALVAAILLLARLATAPDVSLIFALGLVIAFAAASQDIVIDAYAVEVLERDELGLAVGARTAAYRLAMYVAGGVAITLGQWAGWPSLAAACALSHSPLARALAGALARGSGWPLVFAGLALLFVPLAGVAWASREPSKPAAPPASLAKAVLEPLVAAFRKRRAVEILLFIVLYKIGENMAVSLTRPFLIERGFTPADVGILTSTLGILSTVGGTFAGGLLTSLIGMGRTLWLSGILQAVGCLAYAVVDRVGGPTTAAALDSHRLVMCGALATEQVFQGMGGGALAVLLLRLTSKEFSATQFALFSSLMALPRVLAGPFAGILASSLGWTPFFVLTVPLSIPGLVMLHRFVPFGSAEARLDEEAGTSNPLSWGQLLRRALSTFLLSGLLAVLWMAFLGGMQDSRSALLKAASLRDAIPVAWRNVVAHLHALTHPVTAAEWADLAYPLTFAVLAGLAAAALSHARHGLRRLGSEPASRG